jgi:hypothetical protein
MSTDTARPTASEPLCSKPTPNFPALLRRLGISLAVTTYQAGKLVVVRADGDYLQSAGGASLPRGALVKT